MSNELPRGKRSPIVWSALGIAGALAVAAALFAWGRAVAAAEAPKPKPEPRKDVRVVVVDGDEDEGDAVTRPYLGVSLEEDTKSPEGGAKVVTVSDGSPADKAGIRRGDTIVGFGGDVIRGPARLTEKIHASRPGDKVDVKLVRKDGRKETVTVEVGERAAPRGPWYGFGEGGSIPSVPDLKGLDDLGEKLKNLHVSPRVWMWRGDRPRLGVELVETTPELRAHMGGSDDAGVLVGKVLAGTPAQKAGVKVGDLIVSVDGERVVDAGALIEAMADKDGKTIDLELVRERKTIHLQVAIPAAEPEEDQPRGPRAMLSDQQRAVREAQRALRRAFAEEATAHGESVRQAQEELRQAVKQQVRRAMDEAREAMDRARTEAEKAARLAAGII